MKEIPLSRGLVALIDEESFAKLGVGSWHAKSCRGVFYACRNVRHSGKDATIYMHRVVVGAEKGVSVDHINGNGLDNRRSNLRCCTHAENMRNRSAKRVSRSRFMGVSWSYSSKRWMARIQKSYLGCFDTEEEAALCYNAAARERFGEFAHPNSVKEEA